MNEVMRTYARCPVCGAHGAVDYAGSGVYRARCGDCYEGDPEAADWRHLQGIASHGEDAVEAWLDDARSFAADDEIPPLPISYLPTQTLSALALQIALEADRQRGWVLYKRAGGPGYYGPASSLPLCGEVG